MKRHLASDLASLIMAAVLVSSVAISGLLGGCAGSGSDRVYDPTHNDYHPWDQNEVSFYARWENETHRDHRDFKDRNSDEQKEYWTWRHQHQ
jgi:hypothetical protein